MSKLEMQEQLDIGIATEELVDVDLETQINQLIVTEILCSKHPKATSTELNFMELLLFQNNLVETTGLEEVAILAGD